MKQESLEGIKQIGRIGLVLTVLASLAAYIFMIFCIAGAIMVHNAPESLAVFSLDTEVNVVMDLSEADLESTAVESLQDMLESGQGGAALSIGGLNLYFHDYEKTADGAAGAFGGEIAEFTFQDLWKPIVVVMLVLAVTCVMLVFNGFFMNSLKKCKSPFDDKVVSDASNFSIVLVIWSVLVAVLIAVLKAMFLGSAKIGLISIVIIVLCVVVFCIVRLYKLAAAYYN